MSNLTKLEGRQISMLDGFPEPSVEERLENLVRELMTVSAMLRSTELHGDFSGPETRTAASAERATHLGKSRRNASHSLHRLRNA
jgi:hypothetical protein